MNEWKEYSLGDITDLVIDYRGKTPLKLGSDWSDSGYRALSAKNIKTGQIVAHDSIRFVDEDLYHKWMKDEVKRGDILITSEAPFGQVFYWDSDEKIVLSQRLFCVRINADYDSRYVYYYMTTSRFQSEMSSRASGTTVLGLRQPELLKCNISVPSLDTQQRIASILSSLDEKIAVNKKICENLEAQAKALFKHWFVDFTPFKDGNFVESELGLIPEGWKVGTLGDIAEFKRGKTITKSDVKEGLIPVVAGGLEPAYYHNQSNTLSRVITISGSGANAGFTRMYYQPVWASDCSFVDNASTSLLHTAYCYLLTNKKNVDALQWGAAQPHVYAKDINKLPLAIAPLDVLNQFEGLVSGMFDLIEVNDKEIIRLSTLRDTLLPKLMSGQIKV